MIVVTGATGHIGNVLIRELIAHGQTVRALLLSNDDTRPLAGLDTEIVYGDVTDMKSLESAFTGAEVVFHLAGIVTIMLKQGVHPKIVQERLGHASIQLTLDTYSHIAPGLQEAAAAGFDEMISPKHEDEGIEQALLTNY